MPKPQHDLSQKLWQEAQTLFGGGVSWPVRTCNVIGVTESAIV
jgi:hypothetical protein